MKMILSALSVAALAACASIPAESQHTASAAIGQAVRVGGLIVTPAQVIEDSRCPADAHCVWAGRLILRTRIDGESWRRTIDLTLGEPERTAAGMLSLVEVTPRPIAGVATPVEAYRFSFELDGDR